jgi:hypothetical protein
VQVEEPLHFWSIYQNKDADTKRGYRVLRFDHAIMADHDPLFDQPKSKLKANHPVGDRGDLNIIITAYCEEMDYIVTKNLKPFGRLVNRLQTDRGMKLKGSIIKGYNKLGHRVMLLDFFICNDPSLLFF